MLFDEFSKNMDKASNLFDEGRYDDAIFIGKQLLEDADVKESDNLCVIVCDLIVYVYSKKNIEKDPIPNSYVYKEIHKYLKILFESYDNLDSEEQAHFRESTKPRFHHLRPMLSLMEEGKPLSEYNPEYEEKKKGGCFIATAVYGSYSAPEVKILRNYRDEVLLKTKIGKLFVDFYYLISPKFVKLIDNKVKIKTFLKDALIDPLVRYLSKKWK